MNPRGLLKDLEKLTSEAGDRAPLLQRVPDLLKGRGNYHWVGLYDVNRAAGVMANIVWSGPGAAAPQLSRH